MKTWVLPILCALTLSVILVAGLWPFHSPRNHVQWIPEESSLDISRPGTLVSTQSFSLDALDNSCCGSIEVWLRPTFADSENTFLAFHTQRTVGSFSLRQSDVDLLVEHQRGTDPPHVGGNRMIVHDIFRAKKLLFLTVTAGRGTSVYVNGNLVETSLGFHFDKSSFAGKLILGTSPYGNDSWQGKLRGLALYDRELTPAEVRRHYGSWTVTGRPALVAEEGSKALYLFDEGAGSVVHDRLGSGVDLAIPKRYYIVDEVMFAPFWQEFSMTWNYWEDTLINIAGFMPLGFLLCAVLSQRGKSRPELFAVLIGGAITFTIEFLQAYLPTRDSDTTDVITNTLGTLLGVFIYRSQITEVALEGLRTFFPWLAWSSDRDEARPRVQFGSH